jgi:hypothetical protein
MVLVALSYLGCGDPVWLIEPGSRRIVARALLVRKASESSESEPLVGLLS